MGMMLSQLPGRKCFSHPVIILRFYFFPFSPPLCISIKLKLSPPPLRQRKQQQKHSVQRLGNLKERKERLKEVKRSPIQIIWCLGCVHVASERSKLSTFWLSWASKIYPELHKPFEETFLKSWEEQLRPALKLQEIKMHFQFSIFIQYNSIKSESQAIPIHSCMLELSEKDKIGSFDFCCFWSQVMYCSCTHYRYY